AATCGKRANPIRMRDLARFTFCYDQVLAAYASPSDVGRARASAAIDAMTIAQGRGPTLQHVSCPAANASTSQLHKISLAHFNHELTRMNTNYRCSCGRIGCASSFRFQSSLPVRLALGHHRLTRRQYASYSSPKFRRNVSSSYN